MKHRYNNPRCQDGGSLPSCSGESPTLMSLVYSFLGNLFSIYFVFFMRLKRCARFSKECQTVIDSVFSLSCVCVCVCTFPRSRRFKYLCYIPQRSFLWPLIRTVETFLFQVVGFVFFFVFFFLLDFIKIFAVWLRRIYRKQKFKWKKKGASSNDRCLQRLCVPFFLLLLFRSRRLLLWPLPSGKHIVKQLKREKKTSDSLIPLSADEREM